MNPGVYEILNTRNGKRYVGSTVDIRRRWNKHRRDLEAGAHYNLRLQRSWCKYGSSSFEFRVLLFCAREHCVMYEQIAMDALRPELNILPTAGSPLGVKRSAETRARHSIASKGRRLSDESKAKIAAAHLGRKHPPEFGAAISARNTGVPRPKSDEHRKKLSAALMGHRFNVGIPKSQEHRDKLSKARKGVPNPKNVGNKSRAGMKTDREIVERQRASLRAYWQRKKAAAAVGESGKETAATIAEVLE